MLKTHYLGARSGFFRNAYLPALDSAQAGLAFGSRRAVHSAIVARGDHSTGATSGPSGDPLQQIDALLSGRAGVGEIA